MGVLYDYFIAPGDAEAAATIDRPGGPLPYRTIADTGIDPVVQGGTLEVLLTGRPYDEIEQDPRWGHLLAMRDGGEGLVLTLTNGLIDALAEATQEQLLSVAVPWSQTDEFWGTGDLTELAGVLHDLAGLSREARARGELVYCWVSL